MKVIVTGGCGFIGFNLCQSLSRDVWADWEIMVVDDYSSGRKENKIDGVEYVEGDISTPGLMNDLIGHWQPQTIFHFAAIPRISYSVENPLSTANANVIGTLRILDAVKNSEHSSQIRIIVSSSSSVYGGAEQMPTPECHPDNPQSPYALQKAQADQWCKMYAKLYDLDVVMLRYFNVFGCNSYYSGAYSTVLSAWLYSLYVDRSIQPYLEGDGLQSRDFCCVDNVVHANILAATHNDIFSGELFNIAQGHSHTLLEVKELLEKISDRTLELDKRPPRIGDVRHTMADITKARNILGYNPTTNFEEQVEIMAEWYQNGYGT
jgi:nucleoside-diphosphate-sugar epimerase